VSYYLAPMRQEDIPEVSKVERQCFTNPWPQSAYRREIRNITNNYYVVLWHRPDGVNPPPRNEHRGPLALLPFVKRSEPANVDTVAGFAGMWVLYDEAHVTTIGVGPQYRGKGLGELLMIELFEQAAMRNAEWLTLEVRVSNDSAQALYEKYGFTRQGVRKRYYSDNGEDAYIMWSPSLLNAEFQERYDQHKARLLDRLAGDVIPRPADLPPLEADVDPDQETTNTRVAQ
jgi:[ribosomal protein S18]-alanine N-acetyltransferase